jgi:NSS family neurotransmitter:Na+ symporter
MKKRESFSGKFAFVAAAAGSAVGLGNIWKFPYEVGSNGGAAFILVYLFFILLIGFPLMLSEFAIGRRGAKNPVGSFVAITGKKRFGIVGLLGVIVAFIILAFYGVVAGWTIEYVSLAVFNSFAGKTGSEFSNLFNDFVQNPYKPIIFQFIFMFFTAYVVIAGIKNGIEKYSKILMPIMVVIIIILNIWSLTLPGAGKALDFLFAVDFSKITTDVVIMALGQAFFSLSLGMGILLTYGSYIKKDNNLINSVSQIAIIDTLIAILAGIAIFPAVFSYGIEPGEGAGLVFIVLPNIFSQMTGGYLFGVAFFFLIFIAALTSSISILEVVVSYCTEELKLTRKKATIIIASLVFIIGIFCSLSLGILDDVKIFGKNIFDFLEFSATNVLLPLSGLLLSIFIGWFLDKKEYYNELTNNNTIKLRLFKLLVFLIKFVIPLAIVIIFIKGIGII